MINGNRYPIRSVEEPAYVHALAGEIDNQLRLLMGNGNLSLNEALVLMSMDYLDSYKKADRNLDNMRGQLTEYMEDSAKARVELGELRKEIEFLQRKLKNKNGGGKEQPAEPAEPALNA